MKSDPGLAPWATALTPLRGVGTLSAILERSSHRLQRRERITIPGLSIVVSVARLNERILCINNFQGRRLAGLITESDQAKALCRQIGGAPEAIDCRARGQGFVVKRIKTTEQLPLYLRQLDARLLLARLRLTDLAPAYAPIENRQCEVSHDIISEVGERTILRGRRNGAV